MVERLNLYKSQRRYINTLRNKIIPNIFPTNHSISNATFFRWEVIETSGFIPIANEWIKPLAKFLKGKRVLEVMSGTGVLGYGLKMYGVDIKCTDNYSWDLFDDEQAQWKKRMWTDVEKIDAIEAIQKYGKESDYLLMSWPYMDDMAYLCAKEYYKVNPNGYIIYIGEGIGGCTANDNFFYITEFINDENFEEIQNKYKPFLFINDTIELRQYNPNNNYENKRKDNYFMEKDDKMIKVYLEQMDLLEIEIYI